MTTVRLLREIIRLLNSEEKYLPGENSLSVNHRISTVAKKNLVVSSNVSASVGGQFSLFIFSFSPLKYSCDKSNFILCHIEFISFSPLMSNQN